MRGSKDSKESEIIEAVRKIVAQHEIDGITKNEIIGQLTKNGVAVRRTFYKYFDEGAFKGILEVKKVGIQQEKCFPTEQNRVLVILQKDLKKVNNLLDMIDDEPLIGDCFAANHKFRGTSLLHLTKKNTKNLNYMSDFQLFDSIESSKPSKGYFSMATIYSLASRQNIVKDLPSFLINYINNPYKPYPEQVKEEFLRMIIPVVNRCLKILQRDYSESFSYSNPFKETFSNYLPENKFVHISIIKGNTTPDIVLEFLKALGRYSLCFSLKQALDKKHDSTKQLEIISTFITTFYEPFLGKNSPVDPQQKTPKTKFARNFVTQSIINSLIKNTDLKPVKDYYIKLFRELEMFSNEEKILLREKSRNV